MVYEYQNKKAPLASLEEDFEEINGNDTGTDYEPAFFTQASGSGADPNLNGLQQRLLAGYKADKSDELQEFRKHGYNIDELRVDKALLEDFIQELDGLPEFSDWSITSTANALMSMIESVEKMDVKALNGEQKKVMRRVIDLSRQATDVVMMAALHLPLGGALLAAREDRAALGDDAPTEEDIAEVTANLKTTRGAIKQVRLAALDLDLRIPDKEMPWPTFKEDLDRLYLRLRRLGEGKVKMVKKTLTPDKPLMGKVQTILPSAVDMAKAVGSGTVKGLKKLPTNKQEWEGTIRQVGKLSKRAGTSIRNKGKTVRPSLNSLTARMGWAVKNTKSQTLYGTQEKFLQASDEEAEFRESLKLLVEQIHLAMSAYLKHAQALAGTPQEEVEQRVVLRQQRQAAIDRVELLEKILEEKEAGVLKEMYPGQAEKVVPFLEGMKKEMGVFWQAAAQLDSLLGDLLFSPIPEEEEPIFPENKQGELIAALGKVTNAQNRLKQRVVKATLKPFDELSVDWRIARDIGRYFYARREALLGNNTPASMAQFDAAVEEVIWTQVAGDFRKTRSPRGKQMAVRASWAYREAIAGTLQRSKTVQEIVDEQDNVDTQLIKLGQKSLVGRAAFAGVSGNVGQLIAAKPRNVLIPNLGVVKVLLSPISFWNDYRKLSRAVEPGDAFSWGSYRKMAQRNAFRQAFRILKFALPRVATTGISGVLALWALYRAGIGDTFKKALTEGITVMPIAGGLSGANKLAGAALQRKGVADTAKAALIEGAINVPVAGGPSQIKRNIESSETNVSPPDHSQRSQNAIVVDRKLAESSRGSGALQQAGNSVVASEQGTNAAETDTEKTLSRSRRGIFPTFAPVSDESLEIIAKANGSVEEIIKDKLLDICKRYNINPRLLYEKNITLTYTNGPKANFDAHTIQNPPPSQSYVPSRYRGSITRSINVSIVDLATGDYAEELDKAAYGGKLALLSHNIKWPKEIPENMRAEIMEGPFDKILHDTEQTYKFSYSNRHDLGIKRIREILKKHNIDYYKTSDKIKTLSIHVNGWNRGGGDLTLSNCFLIGDTVYFNDSDGTSIKVSDLNKFLENEDIPDKYKNLIIDGIGESDMESLKKYNDPVEDVIFKKSHNGFSWPFSEMHTPKINVIKSQSFEKLAVAIGEDLSGKTYRSLNDVITTKNDIKNKKVARVVTGLIKSAGMIAGPTIGATTSFLIAAAEKVPGVVEIILRDKDGNRLDDLKGAAQELAVDAALLGASKGSKVFASNNVGGIVDKNRSNVLEAIGQIKDALEAHENASEEMEKESKDENSQENQRDTITEKNENSENDSWILAENNANNVLMTKSGDAIDILTNKPIIFTVEDTEGKKTEYVFKTQKGVSRFRAAGIIAEEVNDKNIGFKIGEMTESGIKPVNSQFKNKIWVKKGVNGKPMYKVSSRIGKT